VTASSGKLLHWASAQPTLFLLSGFKKVQNRTGYPSNLLGSLCCPREPHLQVTEQDRDHREHTYNQRQYVMWNLLGSDSKTSLKNGKKKPYK
jgi:hypothetical protein